MGSEPGKPFPLAEHQKHLKPEALSPKVECCVWEVAEFPHGGTSVRGMRSKEQASGQLRGLHNLSSTTCTGFPCIVCPCGPHKDHHGTQ